MKNALLKMLALAPLLLMSAPLSSHAEDGPPTAGILQWYDHGLNSVIGT